jgi:hypothetical protein
MADVKTIVVESPSLAAGPGARTALEGGAVFVQYQAGPWPYGALEDWAAVSAAGPREALARAEAGEALTFVKLSGAAFDGDLAEILERCDRRTVLAVVAPEQLIFFGFGVNVGRFERPASSVDVLPTLAQTGEFFLAPPIKGAVLYEALKNPNFKQVQIAKLKAALARLEKALKRDEREPWDKHDCA